MEVRSAGRDFGATVCHRVGLRTYCLRDFGVLLAFWLIFRGFCPLEFDMMLMHTEFRGTDIRLSAQLASPQVALIGSCRHACHQARGRNVFERSELEPDVSNANFMGLSAA